MTELESKIWDMTHRWCDAQHGAIPDQNRRYLMDEIKALVLSNGLADVVCSSCGAENSKRWDKYEITLNDKDGTDVDVSVDYCEDCGHVFKLREY